jgi:hypothetical protein
VFFRGPRGGEAAGLVGHDSDLGERQNQKMQALIYQNPPSIG